MSNYEQQTPIKPDYDPAEHRLSDRLDRIEATLARIEAMIGDQTAIVPCVAKGNESHGS